MELQRVLAPDSRSAMEKVIQLYGRDALVVSNKKAKNQTEIIVAIDLADHTQTTLDSMHVPHRTSHVSRLARCQILIR